MCRYCFSIRDEHQDCSREPAVIREARAQGTHPPGVAELAHEAEVRVWRQDLRVAVELYRKVLALAPGFEAARTRLSEIEATAERFAAARSAGQADRPQPDEQEPCRSLHREQRLLIEFTVRPGTPDDVREEAARILQARGDVIEFEAPRRVSQDPQLIRRLASANSLPATNGVWVWEGSIEVRFPPDGGCYESTYAGSWRRPDAVELRAIESGRIDGLWGASRYGSSGTKSSTTSRDADVSPRNARTSLGHRWHSRCPTRAHGGPFRPQRCRASRTRARGCNVRSASRDHQIASNPSSFHVMATLRPHPAHRTLRTR